MSTPREIFWQTKSNLTRGFPVEEFTHSCLIYSKINYGIFLLTDKSGKKYTVKVGFPHDLMNEERIAQYIKSYSDQYNMINLLTPIDIYLDQTPLYFPLFNQPDLSIDHKCREENLRSIFRGTGINYMYYLTKACESNLALYLGRLRNKLTYFQFVAYAFQFLAGVAFLHRLGIWHRDIKFHNILVCDSEINQEGYKNISYNYDGTYWVFSYEEDLQHQDIKIIDYGESRIIDMPVPCQSNAHSEIQTFSPLIINFMWGKVQPEEDRNLYQSYYDQLITNLKQCQTNLIDVLFNSQIFHPYMTETEFDDFTFKVKFIEYD